MKTITVAVDVQIEVVIQGAEEIEDSDVIVTIRMMMTIYLQYQVDVGMVKIQDC